MTMYYTLEILCRMCQQRNSANCHNWCGRNYFKWGQHAWVAVQLELPKDSKIPAFAFLRFLLPSESICPVVASADAFKDTRESILGTFAKDNHLSRNPTDFLHQIKTAGASLPRATLRFSAYQRREHFYYVKKSWLNSLYKYMCVHSLSSLFLEDSKHGVFNLLTIFCLIYNYTWFS